ncbi:MAG: hypothetical protein AB7P23_06270 [Amphiplicatus sp.]
MGDDFSLEDALIILKRRLAHFILPVVILAPLGVLAIMLLPAKYTAQGTILVESAQIPADLVRSTINAYAQERIQTIKQRVMTRPRLLEIADKYALFPKEAGLSESERVDRMRARLKVSLITTDGRTFNNRDNTIAFNVSYTDRSAEKAFQVANEFMSAFLTEDVRARTAGASNTTEFFKQESQRIAADVAAMEQRIADYKSANSEALPEHLNMHLATLERLNRDLAAQDASIAALDEEVRFLETQLTSYFAGAGPEDGPGKQLQDLKSELVRLRSVYHDAHPSVQAVKDQIAALEREMRPSKEIQTMQSALAKAEADLQAARRALEAGDPALAEKQAAVEKAQAALSDRIARETAGGGDLMSAQLKGRISVANSRRALLVSQRKETEAAIADLQQRIAKTPEVERGLQALTRNYENVFKEYQDVLAKQQEAQLAENLEDNQKAEKFSVLEPALKPELPSSPERAKLIVLALIVSLGVGGAIALGAEFLSATLRGRAHLEKLIEGDPIAVIPQFGDDKRLLKGPLRLGPRGGNADAPIADAA